MTKQILTVLTISGKKTERSNCIKIREKYHEKNVDAFRINEKWVSIHFNNISIDCGTNSYNFTSKLYPVLTQLSSDSKYTSIGQSSIYYKEGEQFTLYDRDPSNLFYAISKEQYDSLNLKRCSVTNLLMPNGVSPHKKIQKYQRDIHDFQYAVSLDKALKADLPSELISKFGLITKNYIKTGGLQYSFGTEIETSGGVIPKVLANGKLNIDYVYDGSVYDNKGNKYGGGEIVTGILVGTNGIKHLEKITNIAKDRCVVNPSCGIHVHVGGFKPTDEFAVNAYMLGFLIQTDLFEFLPKKRRFQVDYAGNITGNVNEYCKMLPKPELFNVKQSTNSKEYNIVIQENYNSIFKIISGGYNTSDKYNRLTDHPKGKKCGYDHHSMRYAWLNLVPTIFNTRNNKSYTLEFRNHSETLEFTKIYYWVLFCLAFVSFCENYSKYIYSGVDDSGNPLSVLFILEKVYKNKSFYSSLITYYQQRKQFFINNANALEENFVCA